MLWRCGLEIGSWCRCSAAPARCASPAVSNRADKEVELGMKTWDDMLSTGQKKGREVEDVVGRDTRLGGSEVGRRSGCLAATQGQKISDGNQP